LTVKIRRIIAWAHLAGVVCCVALGCQTAGPEPGGVPEPIDLLLPQKIRIHPFTSSRTFDNGGARRGIEVRIEATDAFGDATKAFGKFRFELYRQRPRSLQPRGGQIATWTVDLTEPKANLLHWDNITRTYVFKLEWNRRQAGQPEPLLVTVFESPFTERMFDERALGGGQ
jgi:hypothetical protein